MPPISAQHLPGPTGAERWSSSAAGGREREPEVAYPEARRRGERGAGPRRARSRTRAGAAVPFLAPLSPAALWEVGILAPRGCFRGPRPALVSEPAAWAPSLPLSGPGRRVARPPAGLPGSLDTSRARASWGPTLPSPLPAPPGSSAPFPARRRRSCRERPAS